MQANFTSASKTFYFRAYGNGTVSHSSVTYKFGDAPVTVTATPMNGCTFSYWEIADDEMGMNEYYSPTAIIVVNDDFCNDPVVYNGCIFQASFTGTLTNMIRISNVRYMGGGYRLPLHHNIRWMKMYMWIWMQLTITVMKQVALEA